MEHDLDLSGVPGTPVLVGIGGSHAYGMAHANSDIDYRGVYVFPTRELFRLSQPSETYDSNDPDVAMHEVRKFLRLAAGGNPSVLEALFFSDYVIKTDIGVLLLDHREMFVTDRIRGTHLGYANQQLQRIKRRDNTAAYEDDKRSAKNARHLLRLIKQVERALITGEFCITVENRDEIFSFGELPHSDMIHRAEQEIERVANIESTLPPHPDLEAIDDLLIEIREAGLFS